MPGPGHYDAIRDQLIEDLKSVLGATTVVCFGPPRRELTVPNSVVSTSYDVPQGHPFSTIRGPVQEFVFEIECKAAIPEPYPENGAESTIMGYVTGFHALMMPISTSSMPTPTAYAGVATYSYIGNVKTLAAEDATAYIAFGFTLTVFAVVKR